MTSLKSQKEQYHGKLKSATFSAASTGQNKLHSTLFALIWKQLQDSIRRKIINLIIDSKLIDFNNKLISADFPENLNFKMIKTLL